ncbi:MAG: 50S ribosomal protein L23 [Candidatus Peribacteraceae bacterium]|nr:50S ribosomal protein L23 [Candidatus Peribacteraceae bacterium]
MELNRIILGQVQTEKSERERANRIVTIRVAPQATKIDIQSALKRYFGVTATSVRIQRVGFKYRELGAGKQITRRHAWKKAIVTLAEKSPTLDLASFQAN